MAAAFFGSARWGRITWVAKEALSLCDEVIQSGSSGIAGGSGKFRSFGDYSYLQN
jgi:hypothetical protein